MLQTTHPPDIPTGRIRGGKLGFSLTQDTTDVIYAEDEEVFRETAVRELLKLGFLRQDFSCSREGEVGHIFGP